MRGAQQQQLLLQLLLMVAAVATFAAAFAGVAGALPKRRMNVLLIVCDDLRPELGAYNHTHMLTPHMDQLAEGSLLFERAFTNYAYCCPSRNSFM
jgi:iduronate 2-sulfatase